MVSLCFPIISHGILPQCVGATRPPVPENVVPENHRGLPHQLVHRAASESQARAPTWCLANSHGNHGFFEQIFMGKTHEKPMKKP